ncbi:MAG TPA: aminotransferase class V-fold PLP-dependent enzyme [Candidatus Macondimonas sp.]|nr:aminotransferase class V-fold PLP-dependent enzyme [Candidatus Macondimonas sp.]
MSSVYLDHNATTPLAPEALAALLPYLGEEFGNPSSPHQFAEAPATAVREARAQVAALLGAQARDIHFTSGATESIHWAIQGALALRPGQRQVITTVVEHPAVLKLCRHLEQQGVMVTYLPVDREGRLRLHYLEAALTPQTALVSVMAANNETGVLFPIAEIAALTQARGVLLHVDAAQTAGKQAIDLGRTPIDLLSLSGHKLHGPKGIGALYIRNGVNLPPLFFGTQERGRRGGSLNVPAIVGLGAACRLAAESLASANSPIALLRDRLEAGIRAIFPAAHINGGHAARLAGTSNISFPGIEGEALVDRLDRAGFAVANGAACTVGGSQPSHVLMAMHKDETLASSAVRFSFSRYNTIAEVERLLTVLPDILSALAPEVAADALGNG